MANEIARFGGMNSFLAILSELIVQCVIATVVPWQLQHMFVE